MDLSMIKKASDQSAGRGTLTTVFGDAGVGKTVFASYCWPNPLVIPIEWGLLSVPWIDATPQPKKSSEVFEWINAFGTSVKHGKADYKTLILDSVSKYDAMVAAELCDKGDVESLAKYGGGYGVGTEAVRQKHQKLRDVVERLLNIGIHVVVISHAAIKDINPPDGESYHQWNLQMTKGGREQWLNQTDAVIHIKSPMIVHKVVGEQRKVAKDTGDYRVINMMPSASTTAKNRFGVDEELIFQMYDGGRNFNNPIAKYYGFEEKSMKSDVSTESSPVEETVQQPTQEAISDE